MNKERLKSLLFNCEVRITAIITDGVANRAPKKDVMRLVRSELSKLQFLSDSERNRFYVWATRYYARAVKAADRKLTDRSERISSVLDRDIKELQHLKNSLADDVEYRIKHQELTNILSSDQKFFYCTVLSDPASDHAAYQGKIYYRDDAEYTEGEMAFIKRHQLLSVRQVTLEAPWLCTRPNCRHRLVPYNDKEVKEQHNLTYKEKQYRFYRDRLKYLKAIRAPKEELAKTRGLMRKWRS